MEYKKTIKENIKISGIRQSDGKETSLIFSPTNKGLFVKYKNKTERISPIIINFNEKRYTNSIFIGNQLITMVEHVFSAINGLGIDNLIIEFESDEAPFFTSSIEIAEILEKNIILLDDKTKDFLKINKEIKLFGEDDQYCEIKPADDFEVDITIDFKNIIGKQNYKYSFKNNDYLTDISFARSILIFEIDDQNPWINFKQHFDKLPKVFNNDPKKSPFIAYNDKEFITPLLDPLEPVKHKLLDFIGDLIFLGKIPKAKFEIYKPGHSFNRKIVKYLYTEWIFEEILEKIPEFKMLNKIIENNIVHKKENIFDHTKKVFKNTLDLILSNKIYFNEKKIERFLIAVFLHDYGKKFTFKIDKNGLSTCEQHELMSVLKIKELCFLDRFNLKNTDKEWILNFIKHHNEIHKIFDNKNTIENLNKFKYRFKDDFIENLIFGIADIKDSYFKEYNNIEYNRRIQILESELNKKISKLKKI